MVVNVMVVIMMMRIIMKIWRQSFTDENTFFYRTPLVAASENNEKQQLFEGVANSCQKTVSPILLQELINDFAICKHCSGTLLLIEDETSSDGWKLEVNIS